MRIGISNSEVQEWNTCQASWLRKYHPDSLLAKKDFGPARTRGIVAHSSLEEFYAAIKDGQSYEDAVEIAMNVIAVERAKASEMSDADKMKMLRHLYRIMAEYYVYYKSDVENFEIISTENFHAMEADPEDDFYLPMRLDMVIYQRKGKFAGEISPWDHKTTNDWWPQALFLLNSQLPLYIRALRENGFRGHPTPVIARGIFNFIRTRDIANPYPSQLFDRKFITPNRKQIEFTYQNHLAQARSIVELKRLPFAEAMERIAYNLGSHGCKYCDYKSICQVIVEGGDPASTIVAEYGPNTYGYAALESFDAGQ